MISWMTNTLVAAVNHENQALKSNADRAARRALAKQRAKKGLRPFPKAHSTPHPSSKT
jgi:hypothetical protein